MVTKNDLVLLQNSGAVKQYLTAASRLPHGVVNYCHYLPDLEGFSSSHRTMSSKKEKHNTAWNFSDRANEHDSTPPVPPTRSTKEAQRHEGLQVPSNSGVTPKTQDVLSLTPQSTINPFRDPPTIAVTGSSVPAEQTHLQPDLQYEAPWKIFEKVYECDLAGTVVVAVRRAQPMHIHAIRAFASQDADQLYYKFRHLQHENVMRALHCFTTKDAFYAEFKHFPLSLEQIVACKYFPDEQQLAMILRQVQYIPSCFTWRLLLIISRLSMVCCSSPDMI